MVLKFHIQTPKYKLNRIYFYFSLLALILHELSHIIAGLFCAYYFKLNETNSRKDRKTGEVSVFLYPEKISLNILQVALVPLAPLYAVIIVFVFALFYTPLFIVLFYLLMAYRYTFPSKSDWAYVKYYKVYRKYGEGDRGVINRFFAINGLSEKENLSWIDEKNLE